MERPEESGSEAKVPMQPRREAVWESGEEDGSERVFQVTKWGDSVRFEEGVWDVRRGSSPTGWKEGVEEEGVVFVVEASREDDEVPELGVDVPEEEERRGRPSRCKGVFLVKEDASSNSEEDEDGSSARWLVDSISTVLGSSSSRPLG